LIRFNWT